MTHRVKLSTVMEAYTNCLRHALCYDGKFAQYLTQEQFEQRWLIDRGITPIRQQEGDVIVGYLEFRDRNHMLMFLLEWS